MEEPILIFFTFAFDPHVMVHTFHLFIRSSVNMRKMNNSNWLNFSSKQNKSSLVDGLWVDHWWLLPFLIHMAKSPSWSVWCSLYAPISFMHQLTFLKIKQTNPNWLPDFGWMWPRGSLMTPSVSLFWNETPFMAFARGQWSYWYFWSQAGVDKAHFWSRWSHATF